MNNTKARTAAQDLYNIMVWYDPENRPGEMTALGIVSCLGPISIKTIMADLGYIEDYYFDEVGYCNTNEDGPLNVGDYIFFNEIKIEVIPNDI